MKAIFRISSACIFALSIASGQCGEISEGVLTDDASTGIASSHTYTHAIDFKKQGAPITEINGVTFTDFTRYWDGKKMKLPEDEAFSLTQKDQKPDPFGDFALDAALNPAPAGSGLHDLLSGFLVDWSGGWKYTDQLTLSGLKSGKSYQMRIYYVANVDGDDRSQTFLFDSGDGVKDRAVIHPNDGSSPSARYIQYDYTAASNAMTVQIIQRNEGMAFRLFGLTNMEAPSQN